MYKRIFINAHDVSLITGLSIHFARKLLRNIRKSLGKPKRSLVSIYEFANYQHTDPEKIFHILNTKIKKGQDT